MIAKKILFMSQNLLVRTFFDAKIITFSETTKLCTAINNKQHFPRPFSQVEKT